ncbi:hypothetical protein [uncultured Thomasclavelia sp.]|uniref:hypothetical protein n=1 Tax=uncultured Thomasclavelia sp. TaxID=3025759 RepID=UPI0025F0AD4B|nr:hypothetical protein [uncultured Thomasclavelia sp.]
MIIRLKEYAETIESKKLSIDKNYELVLYSKFYSIIEDEHHKQYYINNKYIEKLPRA